MLVDGSDGEASAIQVGQYVRVFPARKQSVVALKEYNPEGESFLPVASFRSPETVLGTATVEFDAASSYGHGQDIISYAWDFGDGNTAEGAKVSHTFADAPFGNYWVTLTVTDAAGAKDSVKQRVVVAPDYLPAQEATGELTDGYRYKHWGATWAKIKGAAEREAFVTETLATEPALNVCIEQFQFGRKEKQPGAGRAKGLRELSGFLKVPTDGWYAFSVVGDQQVWIDGKPIFNSMDTSLKQTYVPLKAGLHSFSHIGDTQDGYLRFSWMTLDGKRVLPEGKTDDDFKEGTPTRWQCYRPLPGTLFYTI